MKFPIIRKTAANFEIRFSLHSLTAQPIELIPLKHIVSISIMNAHMMSPIPHTLISRPKKARIK